MYRLGNLYHALASESMSNHVGGYGDAAGPTAGHTFLLEGQQGQDAGKKQIHRLAATLVYLSLSLTYLSVLAAGQRFFPREI